MTVKSNPSLDAALAHLEKLTKGNPLGDQAPGEGLPTPAGTPKPGGGLDPNPGESKDLVKGADGETDDPDYELGDEEEEDEPLKKGLGDYLGEDLVKALGGEGTEHPFITLVKALDLFAGDVTENVGAHFAGRAVVDEALVKGIASAIEESKASNELVKALTDTVTGQNEVIQHLTNEVIRIGGQPMPARAVQPGQHLEKAITDGTQSPHAGAATPAPKAPEGAGLYNGLPKAELQRKAMEGVKRELIPVEAVQAIDRIHGLKPEHFDLVKAL